MSYYKSEITYSEMMSMSFRRMVHLLEHRQKRLIAQYKAEEERQQKQEKELNSQSVRNQILRK
mgnify:FL=1